MPLIKGATIEMVETHIRHNISVWLSMSENEAYSLHLRDYVRDKAEALQEILDYFFETPTGDKT